MATRGKVDLQAAIKDSLNEMFSDKEFITKITKSIVDKIEQKLKQQEDEIMAQKKKIHAIEQKVDELQQNLKINNICIYGLKEENNENLNNKILEVVNNDNINMDHKLIQASYRVGKLKSNSDKPRPVIVKLSEHNMKVAILKNVKQLKGTKIFIADDLTNCRRNLLRKAKQELGGRNVWSFNGQIFTRWNGKNVKLQAEEDISQYK